MKPNSQTGRPLLELSRITECLIDMLSPENACVSVLAPLPEAVIGVASTIHVIESVIKKRAPLYEADVDLAEYSAYLAEHHFVMSFTT
jgi:hypothetical protein